MTPEEEITVTAKFTEADRFETVERIIDKALSLAWFALWIWLVKLIINAALTVFPYID